MCALMIVYVYYKEEYFFNSASVNRPYLTCGVTHVGAVCHKAGVLLYVGFLRMVPYVISRCCVLT